MTLELKTKLTLQDTPGAHALAYLFSLAFPDGSFSAVPVGGTLRLEIDHHAPISKAGRKTFLDLMRAVDPLLLETTYLRGRLGEDEIDGYVGPDKQKKEKSRARLEHITKQIDLLLPEHRLALLSILSRE